jgi:hypothetical protein
MSYPVACLFFIATFASDIFHSDKQEEESVNRSQMDIKCTTYDIRIWGKKETFISRHILHQH